MIERRSTMSIAVRVLFAIFAGFATASAQAQLLPAWETNIVLTQQDLDMIHGVVTNQVHGKPVETCRFLVHPGLRKLGLGQATYSEHYHLTSCLKPDGIWKLA